MKKIGNKKAWNKPTIEDLDASKTKAGTVNGGPEGVSTSSGIGVKYNGNS